MSSVRRFFILLFVGVITISILIPGLYLPTDILRTIPQYSEELTWQTTHNSLLSDPVFQFEPWRYYAKERLLSGEFPFINNKNSLGSPFFANPINAMFFPLNIFYYFFPHTLSLFIIHFLKMYFLFLFSYLYLHVLKISKSISLLGAFAITFAAFPIVWLHWPQTNVYLVFPLILFITEKIRLFPHKNTWYGYLSLAYGIAILGGHPETLFHIGIIHVLYILIRLKGVRLKCKTFLFVLLGFALCAFQLLPFLEYLFHSFMLQKRLEEDLIFFHPFLSVFVNVLPFLFGSPHLEFYKPFWAHTNFQEIIGGYIGPALLFIGLASIVFVKKNSLTVFWIIVGICTFGVSYGIFPFSVINSLPVFETSANHRFIGFTGFSLITLAMLYIEKHNLVQRFPQQIVTYTVAVILSSALLYILLPLEYIQVGTGTLQRFIHFLTYHIFWQCMSTALFFVSVVIYISKKSHMAYLGMFAAVFFQTALLFFTYNPVTSQTEYYPETDLTRTLSDLPQGTYLEVGNPSIPENSNLIYGFESIENYDALEIGKFREEFDNKFPQKNHWGNVESLSASSLHSFGINYVISDYDVRKQKIIVQEDTFDVLPPLLQKDQYTIPFSLHTPIEGIRVLPATYNRLNDCTITISISRENETPLYTRDIPCTDFYNNMFFTLETPKILPTYGGEYALSISSNASNISNAISFYGNNTKPYLAVLTETNQHTADLRLINSGKNWYLFFNPNARFVNNNGSSEILENKEEYISMLVDQKRDGILEIKRASYPGWSATVDNQRVPLTDSVLLTINLPKGNHFVEFSYIPYSFYIGIVITLISFVVVVFYMLSRTKNRLISVVIHAWSTHAKKANSISWTSHIFVFSISSVIVCLFLVLVTLFIPFQFEMPETTAINWFTVNNYPKNKDFFYFILYVPFVLCVSIFVWLLWIIRK